MSKRSMKYVLGSAVAGLLVAASSVEAQSHAVLFNSAANTWSTLPDSTDPTAPYNQATSINNTNLVVGNFFDVSVAGLVQNSQGWTYNGSSYSTFTAPGSDAASGGTVASGVNGNGVIVGSFYFTANNNLGQSGFIKTGSNYTTLNYSSTFLGLPIVADSTAAYGINSSGVVAGTFFQGGSAYGFTYQNGTYSSPISVPGAINTFVTGINNNGDLVGFYSDASGDHGFEQLTGPGGTTLVTLNTPNQDPSSTGTDLYGINNNRLASGFDNPPTNPNAPFSNGLLFNGTTGTSYMAPGAYNTEFYQLNDAGVVAGDYLGDAVPEPASLGLLAAGALLFARRRRTV